MSKERLEEIKKHRNEADNCIDEYEFEKINFYNLHVDWLIEQAERVQELEKYYISEKRLKELLNGNEDIGELYQFVEDNQKIEDVISMIIKEMGYLAGALDDYNKGFFELEKQNKRYREALEFYAEGKHVSYKLDETDDDLVADYGETARKALEGEE